VNASTDTTVVSYGPKKRDGTTCEQSCPLLPVTWLADMTQPAVQPCLVRDLFIAGSLINVYGESNAGKTYFVLDLALAVAAGTDWRDRPVSKGLVLYVAGEGYTSVQTRIAALRQSRAEVTSAAPFAVTSAAVNLLDPSEVLSLIATIKYASSECGEVPALVILDTFARSIPNGDENSSRDVGVAIAAADRIRLETGAAVCFVHHSGKDAARGARGSNALRCAVDTEVLVTNEGGARVAVVTKQRDLPTGQRFTFQLQPVQLGTDTSARPITACAVMHETAPTRTHAASMGCNQQALLVALREHIRATARPHITSIELRNIGKTHGLADRRRLSEARSGLERDGWLVPCVGGYRFEERR
jgi:hypothetical protein